MGNNNYNNTMLKALTILLILSQVFTFSTLRLFRPSDDQDKHIHPCIKSISVEVKDLIQHTHDVKEDPYVTISRLTHLKDPVAECLLRLVYVENLNDACK